MAMKKSASPVKAAPKAVAQTTPVRNTSIPPAKSAAKRAAEVTRDMIAKRAYEIYASGKGGSQVDNWLRAERELKGA
jgi:hypothetical protein